MIALAMLSTVGLVLLWDALRVSWSGGPLDEVMTSLCIGTAAVLVVAYVLTVGGTP